MKYRPKANDSLSYTMSPIQKTGGTGAKGVALW